MDKGSLVENLEPLLDLEEYKGRNSTRTQGQLSKAVGFGGEVDPLHEDQHGGGWRINLPTCIFQILS